MKMDLRWRYNNVRIKKGDKWKTAFLIPEDAFELMVMFFGLTNSPATFHTMINNLLRDMIKVGDVAVFIDDMIVGMETKKEYDDIVEEVLKKILVTEIILEHNKNYAILALNCMVKNSEVTISVSETYRRDRNKNIIAEKNI